MVAATAFAGEGTSTVAANDAAQAERSDNPPPARKAQARPRREIDEHKARRIGAQYGVYW
jgi:Mrp family chromosome partitioning ATPase